MKTIILNGSPRLSGDTAFLISALKERLEGEVIEVSAYRDKIEPCKDCRYCWKNPGCAVQDDMQKIYADDYDNVVIASPVHMFNLPGPLLSLAGRFQPYYAAKRFLRREIELRPKKAALILVGGGGGSPEGAIRSAGLIFWQMNAHDFLPDMVLSLGTDEIPAREDAHALCRLTEVARRLNQA